ncbi:MAG TPA: carboxypeptidase regulatory-like domain-containing protein [Blastocatellia bacterium]|nr:carboxypeptidase regulatory-like domain-containing protein [Blastocatellia bacterium]
MKKNLFTLVWAVLTFILALMPTGSVAAQTRKPSENERGAADQNAEVRAAAPAQSGSIRGRVLADGSRPVADASVLAFPLNIAANPQSAFSSLLRPSNSDADGKFSLTGLRPGAYSLVASAPGYVLSDADAKEFYRTGDNVSITLSKGAVITGRVTNSTGEVVVGAIVRAIKIREIDNKPSRARPGFLSGIVDSLNAMLGSFKTDDRGIYRIYGLTSGVYQVAAGGRGESMVNFSGAGIYDGDAPTYYPSSTIDTASEVEVRAGDEAVAIDIRYRDHRGHTISGSVTGAAGSNQAGISVMITRAGNSIVEGNGFVSPMSKERGFAVDGLLDGEYTAIAIANPSGIMIEGSESLSTQMSPPRRVTVSGADVTGVELTLEPLAALSGTVTIEPTSPSALKEACKNPPHFYKQEIVIDARGEGKSKPEDDALQRLTAFRRTTPNDQSEFTVGFLRPGVYRPEAQLPSENLFIKSMTIPPAMPNEKRIDAARTGVRLKAGEKVKGLILTIGEGAAGLKGRVVTGEENKPPSEKTRAYLIPAEADAADTVLRYLEADVTVDGAFSLSNLPPGSYWLVSREVTASDQDDAARNPIAWDAGGRLGLRFEGEATKKLIELAPCQRVTDYALKYSPLIKPSKPSAKKPPQ